MTPQQGSVLPFRKAVAAGPAAEVFPAFKKEVRALAPGATMHLSAQGGAVTVHICHSGRSHDAHEIFDRLAAYTEHRVSALVQERRIDVTMSREDYMRCFAPACLQVS